MSLLRKLFCCFYCDLLGCWSCWQIVSGHLGHEILSVFKQTAGFASVLGPGWHFLGAYFLSSSSFSAPKSEDFFSSWSCMTSFQGLKVLPPWNSSLSSIFPRFKKYVSLLIHAPFISLASLGGEVFCHCCCSVFQSCPTLCDPVDCSMPGFPVLHQLPQFAQIHVHRVFDAFQPLHPLLPPSPSALSLSQHQDLFQWVDSSYQVSKIL